MTTSEAIPDVRSVPSPGGASEPTRMMAVPAPGEPGLLLFGAHRRSGTTWLASMLNSHPELHVRNEGWLFNDRGCSVDTWLDRSKFDAWAAGREAQGTWLRDLGIEGGARAAQRGMVLGLLREAARREMWKDWSRLRWIGDKTTMFYTRNIEYLSEVFPDAAFLSMIRDGRDAVVSNLFLIFRERKFHDLPPECSEHAMRACECHASPGGSGAKDVPLFSPPLLRHLAGQWVESVYGARRAAAVYGPSGRFHEVRYEDLVADPARELSGVLEWLGVQADESRVRTIVADNTFERNSGGRARGSEDPLAEWRKGVVGDWRGRFTEQDRQVFKAVAGTLLVELGYEEGTQW